MKFYQRNDYIINSDVNVKFEDLLEMTPDQFKDWVVRLREELTYAWDTNGCPPNWKERRGYDCRIQSNVRVSCS